MNTVSWENELISKALNAEDIKRNDYEIQLQKL